MTKISVAVLIGTRPEAIKMAPVVKALRRSPRLAPLVVATAQHRELLDQALAPFGIVPDIDLDLMRPEQTLADLSARLLATLDGVLERHRPAALLVQGDTTSAFSAALAAHYRQIPVGHVEAGLRTGDSRNPFPEETNRTLISRLARWHFAPSEAAVRNLEREGYSRDTIHLTGNTGIDSLLANLDHPDIRPVRKPAGRRLLLVTTHRRENFGAPLQQICQALLRLLVDNPDLEVLYPLHPNPRASDHARRLLAGHPRVRLSGPLDYLDFIAAMQAADLILSDSGGVQEEASYLGKPLLVLRDNTERPEAVTPGMNEVIGTRSARIVERVQLLLDGRKTYPDLTGSMPYGNGHAADRILQALERHFQAGGQPTASPGTAHELLTGNGYCR